MSNIFLIHGSFGNPNENWFPWLKGELESLGHQVFVPKFPTPGGQSLGSWEAVFRDYEQCWDEETVVIGHSLGPAFLLRMIEERDTQIKAAFFVAGVSTPLANPEFDKLNETFFAGGFDWALVKKRCPQFFVYHSDNDPYIPLSLGEELAENLGVKLKLVKGAGHFNEAAGYERFEVLLEDVEKVLKNR